MTRTDDAGKRTTEIPMAAMALMRLFMELASRATGENERSSRSLECTVIATYEDEDGSVREVICGVSSEAERRLPSWWGAFDKDGIQEGARA